MKNHKDMQTSKNFSATDLTYEKTVTKYISNASDDKKIVNLNDVSFSKDFDELKKETPKKKSNIVYFYLIAFLCLISLIILIVLLSIYLV